MSQDPALRGLSRSHAKPSYRSTIELSESQNEGAVRRLPDAAHGGAQAGTSRAFRDAARADGAHGARGPAAQGLLGDERDARVTVTVLTGLRVPFDEWRVQCELGGGRRGLEVGLTLMCSHEPVDLPAKVRLAFKYGTGEHVQISHHSSLSWLDTGFGGAGPRLPPPPQPTLACPVRLQEARHGPLRRPHVDLHGTQRCN